MIHILMHENEIIATFNGPICRLADKLIEWMESLLGPRPVPRLQQIWDMKVVERDAYWKAKHEWDVALKDFNEKDFIAWLKNQGFTDEVCSTANIHPLEMEDKGK